MSIFAVENQGVNTYLVYKVNSEDQFDSHSLIALAKNKIRGISPVLLSQTDSDKFLKYNISSKVPVSRFLKGSVTKEKLLGVLSGMASAYIAAEENTVDTAHFVLEIDHIYVDATTNEIMLISLPVVNRNTVKADFQLFFKQLIYSVKFDPNENCDYIATLINYLNRVQVFSVKDFKELVDKAAHSTPKTVNEKFDANVNVASVHKSEASDPKTPMDFGQQKPQPFPMPASMPTPNHVPVAPVAPVEEDMQNNLYGDLMPLGGMPPAPKKAVAVPKAQGVHAAPENRISLLSLLTHFSKENLELYKAQKAKKKNAAAQVSAPGSVQSFDYSPVPPAMSAPLPNAGNQFQKQPAVNRGISAMAPSVNGAPAPAMPPITPVAPSPAASAVNQPVKVNVGMPQMQANTPKTVAVQMNDSGETTLLAAPTAGETTVLDASSYIAKPVPHLVRYKTGEKVAVNKPIFRIGKEKSYVDYFISDNTAISRSHADIIVKDNSYYVVDRNSTNHTFVNGTIIENGVENKINPGDKIRFANEEFDFILI